MKELLFTLGGLALGMCLFMDANALDDVPQSLGNNEVMTLHREFKSGAETYFGKLMAGQERRYANTMISVDAYIDFFASQDYTDVPDWELPLLDLVKEGRFNEAIERYRQRRLLETFTPGCDCYESIERYVMLLELSGVRQNAMQGVKILQDLTALDTLSMRPMRNLVTLLLDLRLTNQAEYYIDLFERRARRNPRDLAEVYEMRCLSLSRRSRPDEALAIGRQSIALYDSLVRVTANPQFEVIGRARIHHSMGRICYRLESFEQSLSHIRDCHSCYALQSSMGESCYLTEHIRALYNLAPLAADMGAYLLADSLYTEVERLGGWLFDGNQYQQDMFIFNSMRLRGLACYQVGKHQKAKHYFDLASEALNRMELSMPGRNLEAHQNLYFNIASLYYAEGNLGKALDMDRKVLDMVLADRMHDERRHEIDLAFCYKYIANCLWTLGYETYLSSHKRKTKAVVNYYKEAAENYALAVQYNSKDEEAQAKLKLCDMIANGKEKPVEMPRGITLKENNKP